MYPGVQAHPAREEMCMEEVVMILGIDIRFILIIRGDTVRANILSCRVVPSVFRKDFSRNPPPADPRFLAAGNNVEADHV